MFTKITPISDSQLSHQDVTNLVLSDALETICKLTGLREQEAYKLLAGQINQVTANKGLKNHSRAQLPVIEQNEFTFISSLFN